jgi:hypothetical protein
MTALSHVGTHVLEPIYRFQSVIPADRRSTVLVALPRPAAVTQEAEVWESSYRLTGDVPAARVHQ